MKTQNPWMGRARGSAGNMTSSKVYDKNVMRAKAFEINNPKTAAQTSERNFFADAQKVCQTVTEEQLRSLFGVKPKSKSRRNALLSQLLEAFSINNGVKELDFNKLQSIGNGEKVNTPYYTNLDSGDPIGEGVSIEQFNCGTNTANAVYCIVFDVENKKISIFDTLMLIDDFPGQTITLSDFGFESGTYNAYLTCEKELSLYNKGFGSFILKTRAV